MRNESIHKLLYVVSAILVVGFAIRFGMDVYKYDAALTSAPLYVAAIVRVVEFIVPGSIVFVAATIMKKKYANKEDKE